ncbi:MAG: sugar kinase [Cyanobacteria bacterium QS_8_64_29]|nr:MAG: sugar kinase [Cyanobacteria bacterium QS_8_64_29]
MVASGFGLDFGGTKLAAATLLPGEAQWHRYQRTVSAPGTDRAANWATMQALAGELLQGQTPAAIGVSFGGPVDAAAGVAQLSHHVPGWENVPLKQWLEAAWDAPTQIDNDANAAALGEHRLGAARGCNSALYITVSTGIGSGWILNGRLWHGANGVAGEIGHAAIDPSGPSCLCGKCGCLERLASGPYIAQDVRAELERDPQAGPLLRQLAGDGLAALTAQTVSQAAAGGDPLAQQALDRAAWALGTGIGNAANLLNPEAVVLGGGLTRAGDRFWAQVRQQARATTLPEVGVAIEPAALGDAAPLWGAAMLAREGT